MKRISKLLKSLVPRPPRFAPPERAGGFMASSPARLRILFRKARTTPTVTMPNRIMTIFAPSDCVEPIGDSRADSTPERGDFRIMQRGRA